MRVKKLRSKKLGEGLIIEKLLLIKKLNHYSLVIDLQREETLRGRYKNYLFSITRKSSMVVKKMTPGSSGDPSMV